MYAIRKYEQPLRDLITKSDGSDNQEKKAQRIVHFLKQEMSRKRALLNSFHLERDVAAELLKFAGLANLAETVRQLRLPVFNLTFLQISTHAVLVAQTQTRMSLEEYSRNVRKIRFQALLDALKEKWIDSGFQLSADELLSCVDEQFLLGYSIEIKTKKKKN